ncbi:hypothetical protein PG997_000079 [Apiospora hydei]|uniref:ribonuclease H n=1 Tax=Apiospora hydei TaxID=1337664 RepID=A0ABR1X9X3_9PEZI
MATRFSLEEHVGRPLDDDESVELPMVLTCLADDPNHSIIVAVDSACRNNGRPDARAALGVFFRADSKWNRSEVLPPEDATSQRAELCAALRALELIHQAVAHEWEASITCGYPLKRVILKSDSSYLVSSMTEWIFGWREHGFTTARGKRVQNRDLFTDLLNWIGLLDDIQIQFWLVRREHNRDADGLANAALDAAPASATLWDPRDAVNQRRLESDSYASERVWRWHNRMGHVPLHALQHATLGAARGMDINFEQIQAEFDKGAKCPSCGGS